MTLGVSSSAPGMVMELCVTCGSSLSSSSTAEFQPSSLDFVFAKAMNRRPLEVEKSQDESGKGSKTLLGNRKWFPVLCIAGEKAGGDTGTSGLELPLFSWVSVNQ